MNFLILIFPQINVKITYVNDLINCEMYMKQLESFSNCCIMHLQGGIHGFNIHYIKRVKVLNSFTEKDDKF